MIVNEDCRTVDRIPTPLQDPANICLRRRKERNVGLENGTARDEERRREEVGKKTLQKEKEREKI